MSSSNLDVPADVEDGILFPFKEEDASSLDELLQRPSITTDQECTIVQSLKSLLAAGNGESLYELHAASKVVDAAEKSMDIATERLQALAPRAGAVCRVLRTYSDHLHHKSVDYFLCVNEPDAPVEVRVAIVGNVDAGKSTTLGVLVHGVLDNGRGKARAAVFNHPHELVSGRTSSVGDAILVYTTAGSPVYSDSVHGLSDAEIVQRSAKLVHFSDLAGHEKYFKTTLLGLTGTHPDYAMLLVGSNMGCVGMTKEHLGCALAVQAPLIVVVTKTDIAPPNILEETIAQLNKLLRSPGAKKLVHLVKTYDDVITCAKQIATGRIVPIFCISNVTGENVHLLRDFLGLLPGLFNWSVLTEKPALFTIDNCFAVPGVGTVAAGTFIRGMVRAGDSLLLGPDPLGAFTPCQVKSIHVSRLPVAAARAGLSASLALKKVERRQIRKGMIIAHPAISPSSCFEFTADLVVLYHSTTITVGYEAVVHCGGVQQAAKLVSMGSERLRTGDRATATFRFMYFPEFLVPGSRVIFRDGRTKAIGRIVSTFPLQQNGRLSKDPLNKGKRSQSVVHDPKILLAAFPPLSNNAGHSPKCKDGIKDLSDSSATPLLKNCKIAESKVTGETETISGKSLGLGKQRVEYQFSALAERSNSIEDDPSSKEMNNPDSFIVPSGYIVKVTSRKNEMRIIYPGSRCSLEPDDTIIKEKDGSILIPACIVPVKLQILCQTLDRAEFNLKISYRCGFSVDAIEGGKEKMNALEAALRSGLEVAARRFTLEEFLEHDCELCNKIITKALAQWNHGEFFLISASLVAATANDPETRLVFKSIASRKKTNIYPKQLII